MTQPDAHPLATGMPAEVTVYEVGPRDGLQNEPTVIPVAVKAEFVGRLVAAGVPIVEVTSFVHPRWVPQLADAAELIDLLSQAGLRGRVPMPVLVPNERGLDRAIEKGIERIAVFGSATEAFAQRNLNRSLHGQFEMFVPTVERALSSGMSVRAYLSMCFGDPWEGHVAVEQVVRVGTRLYELGADQLSLGDTIGVATPGHVVELVEAFAAAGVPREALAVHLHDTYGQALANVFAALQAGVTTVDSSAGGLGGCPYAKSATGNLATEDLVWMLHGLGIRTGIDLESLVATSTWLAWILGRPSTSNAVRAIAADHDLTGGAPIGPPLMEGQSPR